MTATHLPPHWSTILDEIQHRLDSALRACATPEERTPPIQAPLPEEAREKEWALLAHRLGNLQSLAEKAGVVVHELDEALAAGETALRDYVADVGTLRSRLAACGERAIG